MMLKISKLRSALEKVSRTSRFHTAPVLALVLFASLAIVLTIIHVSGRLPDFYWSKHNRIIELEELPLGPVTLQGVVTYADESNQRLWIQDESGAIAIEVPPAKAGVHYGQLIRIRARKTHIFDPQVGFSSIALSDFQVRVLKEHAPLPPAAPATLTNLPEKEKNGIRVRIEGVLHAVDYRGSSTFLSLGSSGREVAVVIPRVEPSMQQWVNANLRVTGVSDVRIDQGGTVDFSNTQIRVQNPEDIEKIQTAPSPAPLYSLRDLYRSHSDDDGHRLRLRGTVLNVEQNTFLLIEDAWGVLGCRSDRPAPVPAGTPVEVTGFPVRDGLRIDFSHCDWTQIAGAKVQRPSSTVPLTTIAAVKKLSAQDAAKALPARLTGVVTYIDSNWRQLFFQDATGGIFVKYAGAPQLLLPGDRLTITGMTNAGDFAPVIVGPKLAFLGKGHLPKPVQMGPQAWSGQLDSLFVEVEGIVHPLPKQQNPSHLSFDLYTWFGLIHVNVSPDAANVTQLEKLVDAKVRLRGHCGEVFNSRRQLIGLQLAVYSPNDIQVLARGPANSFDKPAIPIVQLLRFSPGQNFDHRVRVVGSVTMMGKGFFYVQDTTAGARVEADTSGLSLSDQVDVVGYATAGEYSPALTDAVVRIRQHETPIRVQPVKVRNAVDGRFDSQLVSLDGELLSIVSSIDSKTLVLRSEGRTFDAILYLLNSDQSPPPLQEGSTLHLTGICTARLNRSTIYTLNAKAPVGFTLVIRSPADIRVLKTASWWNVRHTSGILAFLIVIVLAGLGWVAILRQRVWKQREELLRAKEKEEAIHQLTTAMQEVTSQRRFTSRVSVQGTDEIAYLSVEFNKMLGELQVGEAARIDAESKLRHLALTDELTGLPNRRLFSDRLSQLLAGAKRSNGIVALIYIDLDGFKLVNDSLGHNIGDILLGQVSERLQSRIRKSDTLARMGGDEFVVALTQLKRKEEAELAGNSLLQVLTAPFQIDSHEISISASLGVSIFPDNSEDANVLLQQADSAMYAAKRSGKGRLLYFQSELGSQVREKMNLENQLRGAIARGEISLHYQPEFDLSSQRLVRFEALARWTHPTLGSIPPDKFIPIAEESGIIIPLGMYILERACTDAVRWQETSPEPIQVAVNVSSIQFAQPTFVDQVTEVLRRTGLSPKLLQIELTESVMLAGTERAAEAMRRLGALGISIAIDDFGTGYSCFSYLPRLPFNTLKIDRSFVRDLGTVEMKAMVQSLVTLAHHLNMQVVVEGVETVEQLEMIKSLGGNQVQGYLLGRPTADPAFEIEALKTGGVLPEVLSKPAGESAMKASAK